MKKRPTVATTSKPNANSAIPQAALDAVFYPIKPTQFASKLKPKLKPVPRGSQMGRASTGSAKSSGSPASRIGREMTAARQKIVAEMNKMKGEITAMIAEPDIITSAISSPEIDPIVFPKSAGRKEVSAPAQLAMQTVGKASVETSEGLSVNIHSAVCATESSGVQSAEKMDEWAFFHDEPEAVAPEIPLAQSEHTVDDLRTSSVASTATTTTANDCDEECFSPAASQMSSSPVSVLSAVVHSTTEAPAGFHFTTL